MRKPKSAAHHSVDIHKVRGVLHFTDCESSERKDGVVPAAAEHDSGEGTAVAPPAERETDRGGHVWILLGVIDSSVRAQILQPVHAGE